MVRVEEDEDCIDDTFFRLKLDSTPCQEDRSWTSIEKTGNIALYCRERQSLGEITPIAGRDIANRWSR